MAYYTALIAAWNGATQPPTGVSGTGLTSGMTTDQKIAAVNGWTITGSIPTVLYATGNQIANCINWAEFNALTAAKQTNVLALCGINGPLLGGSSNTAFLTDGMILATFPTSGPTIGALTALAQATVTPWWQVPVASGGAGLSSPVSMNDCIPAGLS